MDPHIQKPLNANFQEKPASGFWDEKYNNLCTNVNQYFFSRKIIIIKSERIDNCFSSAIQTYNEKLTIVQKKRRTYFAPWVGVAGEKSHIE